MCRHVALGYRFALQKLVEKVINEAKRRAGELECKAEEKKLYERVVSWAGELTVKQLLDWFDCVERVNVRNRQAQHRWSTETTKRSGLSRPLLRSDPLSVDSSAFRVLEKNFLIDFHELMLRML